MIPTVNIVNMHILAVKDLGDVRAKIASHSPIRSAPSRLLRGSKKSAGLAVYVMIKVSD
jgi:hypothetical protein